MTQTIGQFTLPAEHTFDVPQEYAGAYHQIRVQQGTYAIEERTGCHGRPYIGIRFPGVNVAQGWHSSCQHKDERPMTEDVYGWSTPYSASERGMMTFWLRMLAESCGGSYVLT